MPHAGLFTRGHARSERLLSAKLLAANTLSNIVTQVAPLAVAAVSIPILIKGLGDTRFGVLSLSWVVIGYLGLFDLGMGRALTKLVADRIGVGQDQDVPKLIFTSLTLMAIAALVMMTVLFPVAPWISRILKTPANLRSESLRSLYLLTFALPMVIMTAGLRGVLEAYQRLRAANAIRFAMGILTYAGPLAILPFSKSIVAIVQFLVVMRMTALLAHIAACLAVVPALRHCYAFDRTLIRPLFRFGFWTTCNSIIGPLMISLDRFYIGAAVSAAAVSYYSVPSELSSKLWIVSAAAGSVLFPAFAITFSGTSERSAPLFEGATKALMVLLFVPSLALVVFSPYILRLWLGPVFASHSQLIAQVLPIGAFLLGVEGVAYAFLQGIGKPEIPVIVNLFEMPLYAIALKLLVASHGIEGAAFAWTGRAAIDCFSLFFFAGRYVRNEPRPWRLALPLSSFTALLAVGFIPADLSWKIAIFVFTSIAVSGFAWRFLFMQQERLFVLGFIGRARFWNKQMQVAASG